MKQPSDSNKEGMICEAGINCEDCSVHKLLAAISIILELQTPSVRDKK